MWKVPLTVMLRTKPSLILKRRIEAAPAKVYAAWTDPEKIMRWFGSDQGPTLHAETDLRAGGRFRIDFRMMDGQERSVSGAYREVVPDRRLVFTWEQRGSDLAEGQALVSVELRPAAGGTELRFMLEPMFDPTARAAWEGDFRRLARIDIIPDKAERLAEIARDPTAQGYFLAIRELIGEGHDQFADDMFSSHDGRFVYVSRPSFADVVALDVETGKIIARTAADSNQ